MFFRNWTEKSTQHFSEQRNRLKSALLNADAVVIGAGAGLSTSAGFTYAGERFEQYFSDFRQRYGFRDMYAGGFYPYRSLEEYWAYWSRYIWVNRYMDAPKDTYELLLELVQDKDYFVLTTNVDHCFQKAGFDKKRLFYTQGDYGLWQCSKACHEKTYDNQEPVREMLEAQGFQISAHGTLTIPEHGTAAMQIPTALVPRCPVCGAPMTMNLRCDDSFVQDEGWYAAANRYEDFMRRHENLHILYLELGVGANTPVIIKYPFWRKTAENSKATYACVNWEAAFCPDEIQSQSVCLQEDVDALLRKL